MDILNLLTSVNKASILVLVIAAILFLYEFYLSWKEKKRKGVVSVPAFNPQNKITIKQAPVIHQNVVKPPPRPRKKTNLKTVGLVTTTLVMMGAIGVISFRLSQPQEGNSISMQNPRASEPTSVPKQIAAVQPSQVPSPTVPVSTNVITPTLRPTTRPTQLPSQIPTTAPLSTPSPFPSPTAIITEAPSPSLIPTTVPSVSPTGVNELLQSGVAQYSAIFAAMASLIIIASFLF